MLRSSLKGGLQGSPRLLEVSFEASFAPAPQDEGVQRIAALAQRH
ncbi:hypothetical protein ABIE45_005185 [Methylobacterium sp. OAE515]